jgi:hypothetical protein
MNNKEEKENADIDREAIINLLADDYLRVFGNEGSSLKEDLREEAKDLVREGIQKR